MSCEYCSVYGAKPLISRGKTMSRKGDFYSGIYAEVDYCELFISAVPDTYEPGYLEDTIKINFCPMCGRKLEEKE